MTTDTDDGGRSTLELRQMDEQTARNTLPVAEFERWQKLHELMDGAAETRERWADEDETVAELTVHADMDALGTEVDLYGNDVLVHVDSEDGDFRAAAERLDDTLGDTDPNDLDSLDDAGVDAAAEALTDLLDAVLVRWNGTEWSDLAIDTRQDVLYECRRKWGVDGLLLAWFDIAAAIAEDREERVEVVDNFRNPERRGRR